MSGQNRPFKHVGFITGQFINDKTKYFPIDVLIYENPTYTVKVHRVIETRADLLYEMRNGNKIKILNGKVSSNNHIIWGVPKVNKETILSYIKEIRKVMEYNYGTGTDLCGECIEASEIIATALRFIGLKNCKTVEGWCEFDDEYYGSDRPYDPHTWVEIPLPNSKPIYIDITADQFNPGMFEGTKYPPVIICNGLPHGMSYTEPVIYED